MQEAQELIRVGHGTNPSIPRSVGEAVAVPSDHESHNQHRIGRVQGNNEVLSCFASQYISRAISEQGEGERIAHMRLDGKWAPIRRYLSDQTCGESSYSSRPKKCNQRMVKGRSLRRSGKSSCSNPQSAKFSHVSFYTLLETPEVFTALR